MPEALLDRTTIGTEDPAPEMTTERERTAEKRAESRYVTRIAPRRADIWGEMLASETSGSPNVFLTRMRELLAQLAQQNTSIGICARPLTSDSLLAFEEHIRPYLTKILDELREQIEPAVREPQEPAADPQRHELPSHAVTARSLRDITGQPDVELAPAMGVSRVSFSRWATGAPISAMHR